MTFIVQKQNNNCTVSCPGPSEPLLTTHASACRDDDGDITV